MVGKSFQLNSKHVGSFINLLDELEPWLHKYVMTLWHRCCRDRGTPLKLGRRVLMFFLRWGGRSFLFIYLILTVGQRLFHFNYSKPVAVQIASEQFFTEKMKDNKTVELITCVANGSKSLLSYIVICIQYSIVFRFRFQRFKENLFLEVWNLVFDWFDQLGSSGWS